MYYTIQMDLNAIFVINAIGNNGALVISNVVEVCAQDIKKSVVQSQWTMIRVYIKGVKTSLHMRTLSKWNHVTLIATMEDFLMKAANANQDGLESVASLVSLCLS